MYHVNLNSRVATQVLDFGGWLRIVDISYNPIDGKFYGWSGVNSRLVKIDPATWTFSYVGPTNSLYNGMAATAFNSQGFLVAYADYESIGNPDGSY